MQTIDWKRIKAVFFDLDGTIYIGSELVRDADRVVKAFREKGIQVFFVTNNSAGTREQICQKLRAMNIPCEKSEVYSSGYVAAVYVREQGHKEAYIMGTENLRAEFAETGVLHADPAEIVVIGYDRAFDSEKLTRALQTALHAKQLIACNRDANYPVENGLRLPGCGAMVGAMEGSLGRRADVMIGKPERRMTDMVCREHGLLPEELLLVGDSYEYDMAVVSEYGAQGILIGEKEYEDCVTVSKIGDILSLWSE